MAGYVGEAGREIGFASLFLHPPLVLLCLFLTPRDLSLLFMLHVLMLTLDLVHLDLHLLLLDLALHLLLFLNLFDVGAGGTFGVSGAAGAAGSVLLILLDLLGLPDNLLRSLSLLLECLRNRGVVGRPLVLLCRFDPGSSSFLCSKNSIFGCFSFVFGNFLNSLLLGLLHSTCVLKLRQSCSLLGGSLLSLSSLLVSLLEGFFGFRFLAGLHSSSLGHLDLGSGLFLQLKNTCDFSLLSLEEYLALDLSSPDLRNSLALGLHSLLSLDSNLALLLGSGTGKLDSLFLLFLELQGSLLGEQNRRSSLSFNLALLGSLSFLFLFKEAPLMSSTCPSTLSLDLKLSVPSVPGSSELLSVGLSGSLAGMLSSNSSTLGSCLLHLNLPLLPDGSLAFLDHSLSGGEHRRLFTGGHSSLSLNLTNVGLTPGENVLLALVGSSLPGVSQLLHADGSLLDSLSGISLESRHLLAECDDLGMFKLLSILLHNPLGDNFFGHLLRADNFSQLFSIGLLDDFLRDFLSIHLRLRLCLSSFARSRDRLAGHRFFAGHLLSNHFAAANLASR